MKLISDKIHDPCNIVLMRIIQYPIHVEILNRVNRNTYDQLDTNVWTEVSQQINTNICSLVLNALEND